jgi:hypothetical protein
VKLLRWIGRRLRDLFYATGNQHLDLARSLAGLYSAIVAFAVYWNAIHLGKEIDLGQLLTGLAALAGALGLGIAAKDWVRKLANKVTVIVPPPEEPKP